MADDISREHTAFHWLIIHPQENLRFLCTQHIESETKQPPFSRRYPMYFLTWKLLYFDFNFIEISS